MSSFNLEEELASIKRAKDMSKPLLLLLLPIIILQLPFEILAYIFVRLPFMKWNPDASADVPGTAPLPVRCPYTGGRDMFMFFDWMKNRKFSPWLLPLSESPEKSPPSGVPEGVAVRVDNIGFPCVALMDVKTSNVVLDRDLNHHCNVMLPFRFLLDTAMSNMYRRGPKSHALRTFLLAVLPTTEDEQFQEGLKGMEKQAKAWVSSQPGPEWSKKDFVLNACAGFNSTVFTGTYIPVELLQEATGFMFFIYPRFLPRQLFPPNHAAMKAREHIRKRIRASPRWPKILQVARAVGLSSDQACDAILSVLCFNGLGIKRSYHNIIDFMPQLNYCRGWDADAIQSFAWEAVRFNGFPLIKDTTGDEPTVLETSAGQKYAVKPGTNLLVDYYSVNWDPLVWPNPETFQHDRFLESDGTTMKINPLPVTSYGMPLGTLHNQAKVAKTHSCPMGFLSHRILAHLITILSDPTMEYTLPGYDTAPMHMENMRDHLNDVAKVMCFKKFVHAKETTRLLD